VDAIGRVDEPALNGPGPDAAGARLDAVGTGLDAARAGGRAGTGLLNREFFGRPAQAVAPGLLGCVIESRTPDGVVAVALAEVEAYAGEADPASHAYHGLGSRNAVMFGPPGHAYVYFTYGMHFCVNLVCMPAGTASAVLLRGGAIVEGTELARQRRLTARRGVRDQPDGRGGRGGGDGRGLPDRDLARGPARLCQALGVDRSLDGVDVCDPASPLRIRPAPARPGRILRGPRVGVSSAASVPWRFWIEGEPTVSPYRAHAPRHTKPPAPA
jgi:DNA-3-methyladenine glycosylase